MDKQLTWRKSSYSGDNGGDCVEVALTDHRVYVRDTKNRDGGTQGFDRTQWETFIRQVKAGSGSSGCTTRNG